jgi:hypothetical protein
VFETIRTAPVDTAADADRLSSRLPAGILFRTCAETTKSGTSRRHN